MANVGIGISRKLIDQDGDALDNSAGALNVVESIADTITHNAMLDIDNTATVLPTIADCREVFLQADEDNSGYIMIGASGVSDNVGMKLNPGDTIVIATDNSNNIYAWGSAANQNLRLMTVGD